MVPSYTIARLRPRATTTLEYRAVTLNLSVVPRYLFTTEDVTRQVLVPKATGSAKENIYLASVSGWRPYGEVGAKVALDPGGHFALNATYKVGSLPGNFNKTNLLGAITPRAGPQALTVSRPALSPHTLQCVFDLLCRMSSAPFIKMNS